MNELICHEADRDEIPSGMIKMTVAISGWRCALKMEPSNNIAIRRLVGCGADIER